EKTPAHAITLKPPVQNRSPAGEGEASPFHAGGFPVHWSHSFSARQDAATGCHSAPPIHPFHTALAARVTAHREQPGSLLELGAGGGAHRA
ncbi:MAG: hypothetical protein AB1511_11420, partial [Deinococcota bacterium]